MSLTVISSITFTMTLLFLAPSNPPEGITARKTPVNITIAWQPVDCMFRNGNITGYLIRHSEMGSVDKIMDGNTTSNHYTVTDLLLATKYVIEVAAMNSAGIGDFGSITLSTLPCKLICS